MIRPSKYIWMNRGQHVILDAVPVNFKNSRYIPFLPGALSQAPLLIEVISFFLKIGESRKSLHSKESSYAQLSPFEKHKHHPPE
jgi:hypothetical protein